MVLGSSSDPCGISYPHHEKNDKETEGWDAFFGVLRKHFLNKCIKPNIKGRMKSWKKGRVAAVSIPELDT